MIIILTKPFSTDLKTNKMVTQLLLYKLEHMKTSYLYSKAFLNTVSMLLQVSGAGLAVLLCS